MIIMNTHLKNAKVPHSLHSSSFILRPLLETDVELDYQAVMSSQEFLLALTDGRWPRKGFTIEENRADLIHHESLHKKGEEFTYTIINPTEKECLGCLYILPLKPTLERFLNSETLIVQNLPDYSVYTYFWLTPSARKANLQKLLLESLIQWFKKDWYFSQVVFLIKPTNSELFDKNIVKNHFKLFYSEKTEKGENNFYSIIH